MKKRPSRWLNKNYIIDKLAQSNILLQNTNFNTTRDIVHVKCLSCGYSWSKQIKKLLYKQSKRHHRPCGCPKCKLKSFNNKIKLNRIINFSKYGDFYSYSQKARYLTKLLNRKHNWFNNNKLFHIDHIVSIRDCFKNSIPLYICCSVVNLRLISNASNSKKYTKSDMSITELIEKYNKHLKNNTI